jgi:rubrerythrin
MDAATRKGIRMADSDKYKCKVCGAIHGGVYSPDVCAECYKKGLKPRMLRAVAIAIALFGAVLMLVY